MYLLGVQVKSMAYHYNRGLDGIVGKEGHEQLVHGAIRASVGRVLNTIPRLLLLRAATGLSGTCSSALKLRTLSAVAGYPRFSTLGASYC